MELVTPQSRKTLSQLGIFNEAELVSRFHVRLERYLKNGMIEAETLRSIVDTHILPAGFAYHSLLAQGVQLSQGLGMKAPQLELMKRTATLLEGLQAKRVQLESALQKIESDDSEESKAKLFSRDVSELMEEIRSDCDGLESLVADDFWPLPKYREILFLT